MPVARFKDLCIDASGNITGRDGRDGRDSREGSDSSDSSDSSVDLERLGRFWAAVLGLRFEPDGEAGTLVGDSPTQKVWMNVVPEPKSVKHRVHLDVHAASIADLTALGATVLEPAADFGRPWTVLADPEGGEFCAFVRPPDALPAYRLYEVVVDCAQPKLVASWWAEVYGASLGGDEANGWWWLEDVPGLPFEGWSFVPVPEPKTVKNRVHWDVTVQTPQALEELVAAGATVLRRQDDEIGWTVLADPEGNEFCAFVAG